MASMDHTTRSCPPVHHEPTSQATPSVDGPPNTRGGGQERRWMNASEQASAALAITVMEGMLKTHHARKRAHPDGKPMGFLPLNPVQRIGLETAIDLLHHYVDTLTPEEGG
jgi:hypothetical protein